MLTNSPEANQILDTDSREFRIMNLTYYMLLVYKGIATLKENCAFPLFIYIYIYISSPEKRYKILNNNNNNNKGRVS